MKRVAAALIVRGRKLLICQRTRHQPMPLKWEFPGGKIELGEQPADALRRELVAPPLYVSQGRAKPAEAVALADIRQAIRDERKMRIHYIDEKGAQTQRTIWPIALAYYIEATLVAAWCELRADYRHFRADRITSARKTMIRAPIAGPQ
jgi:predicted DNA-binding transcriptional regulator YafY